MTPLDESRLIADLQMGDEQAFMQLVERYQNALLRLARVYLDTPMLAEEAVQETWIGALKGLHHFEGRSSLKTWLFGILIHRAQSIATREGRHTHALLREDTTDEVPVVSLDRFQSAQDSDAGHWHWEQRPRAWDLPEDALLRQEIREVIQQTLDTLPTNQRMVMTLRDIDLFSSDEVCTTLGISEGNQRVLLHRARARVRQTLEDYFKDKDDL